MGVTSAIEDDTRASRSRLRGSCGGVQSPMSVESIVEHPLIEAVERALSSTGYLELRNLTVQFNNDSIELDGRLPSYHLKQLAQSTAKRVPGVVRIVNTVEVVNGR